MLTASLAAPLFAQESNTSKSTNGLFGTDVDDFMSVTSWENVAPEKAFVLLGIDNYSGYNVGFAHQFGSLYWGSYFAGDLGSLSSTTKNGSEKYEETYTGTFNTSDPDGADFTFDNIIGISGFGVKLGFKYKDSGSSTTKQESDEYSTQAQAWHISATAGTNLDVNNFALSPYGKLWFGYNYSDNATYPANSKQKSGSETKDYTLSDFGILAGTGVDLISDSALQHSFAAELALVFDIPGSDLDKDTSTFTGLDLTASYTVHYNPTDNLSLGATASLPFAFGFIKDGSEFNFVPALSTGLTYRLREKVAFNMGIAFNPLRVSSSTSKSDDTTTTTFTSTVYEGITFTSGFDYAFNDKLNFDVQWNVLNSLFNGFTTRFETASTANGFFGNLNILFRSQMSFIVTVKL